VWDEAAIEIDEFATLLESGGTPATEKAYRHAARSQRDLGWSAENCRNEGLGLGAKGMSADEIEE